MSATTTAPRLYPCALCAHDFPAADLIYSRHTGKRYCLKIASCERRRRRAERANRKEPT